MQRCVIESAPTLGYLYLMTQAPPRRLRRCISELSAQGTKKGAFILQLPTPLARGGSARVHPHTYLSPCICVRAKWVPLSGSCYGVAEPWGMKKK